MVTSIIQTVPSRMDAATRQSSMIGIETKIYCDKDMTGPYNGFISSLRTIETSDLFHLHSQDDVIYCNEFADYIPELVSHMKQNRMHLLSLYAPRRKQFREHASKGIRIGKFSNFLTGVCLLISPNLKRALIKNSYAYNGRHDDVYINMVLREYKESAFVHIPSLVQHNVLMPSTMKHATNSLRTSELYDEDFVLKWKASKNLPEGRTLV